LITIYAHMTGSAVSGLGIVARFVVRLRSMIGRSLCSSVGERNASGTEAATVPGMRRVVQ